MRKHRVICSLLALAMILSLGACQKKPESDESDIVSNLPAETAGEASVNPAAETPEAASVTVSTPVDPLEDRADLVILNKDEYMNRPHEIQPGTVLYYVGNDVPSQVPWNCPGDGWLWRNVYEGLLYMYMNNPTDIRGCIAESWEHADDYLVWTFHIRDGVKFHDGTACDADAIAKAWEYSEQAWNAYFTNSNVSSWEAIDTSTFVVHLTSPCAYFEQTMSNNQFVLVSPTALDLYGMNDNQAAVGTGPYYIESYTAGESIVLKASPNYYLEEKMPCIETVNCKILRYQSDIVTSALLNGEVDGADFSVQEYYNSLNEKGYDGNLVVTTGSPYSLWFNAKKVELFRYYEVREAVCRFIDFSAINDQIYDSLGIVQDSLWAKGSSGYVPSDQFYYNPDEGRELLASVGIEPSDIKFEIVDRYNEDIYVAVQNELEKAGIKLDFEYVDPTINFYYQAKDDWRFAIGSWGYSHTAPYTPWMYILKKDTLFRTCFQDSYDPDLYEKMLNEYDAMTQGTTWDEMLAHCKQLTAYVQDDFGGVGIIQPPVFLALSKDFKNGIYFTEQHDIQLYYLYQ